MSQLTVRGYACSFCLGNTHHTRITDCKAQSGGFALVNIHLASAESQQATGKANEAVKLTAGCSGEEKSKLKCETLDTICKLTMSTRPGCSSHSNTHQQSKQLHDWQTPFLPVYVALHLFAPSLGYVSRRSHVWGSACVPGIQMEAAVCKVPVREENQLEEVAVRSQFDI